MSPRIPISQWDLLTRFATQVAEGLVKIESTYPGWSSVGAYDLITTHLRLSVARNPVMRYGPIYVKVSFTPGAPQLAPYLFVEVSYNIVDPLNNKKLKRTSDVMHLPFGVSYP